MAKSNKIAGVILLALFSAGLYMAFSFPQRSAYFPKIICGTGICLSMILIISAIVQEKKGTSKEIEKLSPKAKKMIVIMGALILLYALGITRLGFAVSTFLFMVLSSAVLYPGKLSIENKKPLILILAAALVISVLITVVFKRFLYVPLPSGLLM